MTGSPMLQLRISLGLIAPLERRALAPEYAVRLPHVVFPSETSMRKPLTLASLLLTVTLAHAQQSPLARRVGRLHRPLRHHRPAPHHLRLHRHHLHLRRLRPHPRRQLRHRQQSDLHHRLSHQSHRQPPRRIRLPDLQAPTPPRPQKHHRNGHRQNLHLLLLHQPHHHPRPHLPAALDHPLRRPACRRLPQQRLARHRRHLHRSHASQTRTAVARPLRRLPPSTQPQQERKRLQPRRRG